MGKGIKAAGAVVLGAILAMEGAAKIPFMPTGIPAMVAAKTGESADTETGSGFAPFRVVDTGEELPDNQEYSGLVCNIQDTLSEDLEIVQDDGSVKREDVYTMHLNNIWVSVPEDGGTKGFGVPIFTTEQYAEGEYEARKDWDNVEGEDCPEFNEGMETARKLIREGYFQKPLEQFLSNYPEIRPESREYELLFAGGGRTDRELDHTSWWELDYNLVTAAENGELVNVATIDITKVICAQGRYVDRDAYCRIWSVESGLWRLTEDPAKDPGKAWISQVQGEDFSREEQVRAYVEEHGADFDLLLPPGADREVEWECKKESVGQYEYLIWSGTTDTYELILAVPLMEQGAGGWYMASRIRKESQVKEACHHALSVMMQTFHEASYIHSVERGDSMWKIYKEYGKGNSWKYDFRSFIEYNDLEKPDLIYPDQRIRIPWMGNKK